MIAESAQAESPRVSRAPQKKSNFLRYLLLAVSYVIVGIAVWQIQAQVVSDPMRQQAKAEEEIKSTVNKVSQILLLPKDETPQVAAINDAESLAKTQAFFANAKNGDQILIYLKEQKAIIYRPSENIVINVGPIVTDNSGAGATGAAATTNTSSNSNSNSSQTNTPASTNEEEN